MLYKKKDKKRKLQFFPKDKFPSSSTTAKYLLLLPLLKAGALHRQNMDKRN